MNPDEYLQERIDAQIKWLSSASGKNQQWFKILRAAEIVMGCAIAYLVFSTFKQFNRGQIRRRRIKPA